MKTARKIVALVLTLVHPDGTDADHRRGIAKP